MASRHSDHYKNELKTQSILYLLYECDRSKKSAVTAEERFGTEQNESLQMTNKYLRRVHYAQQPRRGLIGTHAEYQIGKV